MPVGFPPGSSGFWVTSKSIQTPADAFSIVIPDNIGTLILNPAGDLNSGTITLPANPVNGQVCVITSSNLVQSLQLLPNAGQNTVGFITSITTVGRIEAIYNSSDTSWYVTDYGPPFHGDMVNGTPNTTNVPNGFWRLIVDTFHSTTGLYYNNGGQMQVVYLTNLGPPPTGNPTYFIYGF